MNVLQKLLYKLSGHNAKKESWTQELALRDMRQKGIEIGAKRIPTPVMSQGTCPRHPLVLLNNRGHGDYCCMMCKEDERDTDRLPAQIYTQARRTGASPDTAIQRTVRLTQDLAKRGK